MAPEQVKGQETDARTDIYALGMMLYEVLTGRIPFETENEFELMRMQIEAAPTSPRSINPSIPQEVEEAIMRAIQKAPEARFQTAGDFREALLDAGYAAQGQMRRISGSHLAPSNTFSASQFISRPDETPEPTTPLTNVIKETRLGASESHAFEIKATRLGGGDTGSPIGLTLGDQSSASFFDKLNWIHYAGAGGGALVSLVMLVIVSIYAFSGENTTPQPSNTTQVKTSPTPSAAIQAREVTPDTAPTTATPKPMTVAQPVVAENPDPVYVEPIPIPTAASTERVKNDPPAPKPQATPKKKKTGSSKKPQPSAECLLTGNC
jgi:serine/threonine protein kinase